MFEVLPFFTSAIHGRVVLPPQFNARILIVAYPISLFPGETFGSVGPSEELLIRKAGALVGCAEAIMSAIWTTESLEDIPREVTRGLCPGLRDYFAAFHCWKDSDRMPLESRIINALSALYAARLNPMIEAQIEKLRNKMATLPSGGEMLREYDISRSLNPPAI